MPASHHPAKQGSGRIFISYRRQETAYPAAWLFDTLTEHYGRGQVFKDIDSVVPGDDFVEVITKAVAACDVLLALIGSQWVTIDDGEGRRRLDLPEDFVRLEIEEALKRDIRVIPLLVGGASMPEEEDVPPSLARLVRRQALELSPIRFEFDTARLLKVLDKTLGDAPWLPPEAPDEVAGAGVSTVMPVADEAPAPAPIAAPVQAVGPVPRPVPAGGAGGSSPTSWRWPLAVALAAAVVLVLSALLVLPGRGPGTPDPPTTTAKAAIPKVQQTIKVGAGSSGVAVGPKHVWVSNYDEGSVTRLDANGKVLDTIKVGVAGGDIVSCPEAVWVISDGRSIARIDTATRKVTATYRLGSDLVDLATRCGDAVWASAADGTISRIPEGAARAEVFSRVAPDLIADIDVDQQGVLWMSHSAGDALLRLDPKTKEVQSIPLGGRPIGVVATPDGIWVTGSKAGTVSRVDPASRKVAGTVPVGDRPWGAAAGLGAVWVTNLGSNTVSRIDAISKGVSQIDVGSGPDGIAVGHDAVWVANGDSGTVSRIA